MDLGLEGKRVLVTGGTKSIGRAIVEAFVAEGAVVGFCARDASLVKQREEQWRANQARVHGTALDVTNVSAVRKWIDDFAADGGLDHFVSNVSALTTPDTAEGWRAAIEVDVMATVESVRHALPHLAASGAKDKSASCAIIGTTSLVEISGPTAPYRSVKAALIPFAKSLAIEMAPKGVRVNVVSPGTILEDTNGWGRQRDQGTERYKKMLAKNPMGRMGTPQEIAACVVFLAGKPASFVSGINMVADGAMTYRVQY